MQPRRHAVHAEQHHSEERRLEKERGQHFVGEERPAMLPTFVMKPGQLVPNWNDITIP
jgi:hypothetical protein